MSDKPQKMYGFYSERAIKSARFTLQELPYASVYSTPSGDEVVVTAVYRDEAAAGYLWPDKVCVGEVCEWLRDAL